MIGSVSFAISGLMSIYSAAPNPSLGLEERKDAALKDLRALRPYDADTKKKQEIVSELLNHGFDINAPIDEVGGVEVRLIDMACAEMDHDFGRFLVERYADPRLCNVCSPWFVDRMVALFDSLQAKIADPDLEIGVQATDNRAASIVAPPETLGAIPAEAGAVTSPTDIHANAKNASERKVGCCLCSMASIVANLPAVGVGCIGTVLYTAGVLTARLLVVGVGCIFYGGGVLLDRLTTLSVYLPFAIPVVAAWCVGALIDAVCGNDDMYIAQSLGEIISFPAYWIDIATFSLKIVSGLVSALGAGLICAGLNPNEFNQGIFKMLMREGCNFSLNYGGGGGAHRSMHDACYEKIIGPLSDRRWSAPRVFDPSNPGSWGYASGVSGGDGGGPAS